MNGTDSETGTSYTVLLMDRRLEDFAYRIDLSWTTFTLAGLAAMMIAWMTVSYHSLRTALTDPVHALQYK